jgi:hypothetical protein
LVLSTEDGVQFQISRDAAAAVRAAAGVSGVFLFLTYYLQDTRGYSPVATGLAYLPMLVTALVISITCNVALLPRTGPKPLVAAGMLLAAGGMVWLTRIGLHSGYVAAILGPLLISGAGMTTLAVLHGYTTAFWWAAGILAVGAIICGTLLRRGVLAGQGDSGHVGPPASQPAAWPRQTGINETRPWRRRSGYATVNGAAAPAGCAGAWGWPACGGRSPRRTRR